MARVFEFDPSEVKVLDSFTFEEEIQRPESTRFYTLDEQVTDYFEKLVPVGKFTRFQEEQLRKNADRVRRLYEGIIFPTEEAYEARKERPHRGILPWIVPVYEAFTRPAFSYPDLATILTGRERNYMNRLYSALPRPFVSAAGPETSFSEPQRFVDAKGEHPIRALPEYQRNRGILHEDGRYEVVGEVVPGTGDDLRLKGYWIGERELALISPLDGHPILGDGKPHFLNSVAPYEELIPSVDAILTHAVPTTPHPFRDAAPYLRLYDVRWSEIPWSSWKSKFPSVDPITMGTPAEPIEIPQPSRDIPSENLQKEYSIPYRPGIASRHWLMQQRDGGALVPVMLLTQASEPGVVALPNPVQLPEMAQAGAAPEDCLPDGIAFADFAQRGLYRKNMCIPLEQINKERAEVGTRNRKAWMDGTETEILQSYIRQLRDVQDARTEPSEPVIPKVETAPISELRTDVVKILQDTQRTPEDRASDIRVLIQELALKNRIYLDETERFVVCQHTLALLEGALARDRLVFYDTWCARVEGKRVCKYCGEEINRDHLVHQDEFDDEGHVMNHTEVEAAPEFHPGAVLTMTQNLQALRQRFDLKDPAQDVLFLLLSILQVLPDQSQLDPVVNQVRKFSAASKKYGDAAQAIYGVVGTALLMQIHEPFLLPRRSFGRTFVITGYPREGDAKDYGILDSILGALRQTYEQFRSVFKGASLALLKDLYRETAKVREKCVQAMGVFLKPPPKLAETLKLQSFETALEMAAVRYAKAPAVPPALGTLVPVLKLEDRGVAKIAAAECVPSAKISLWTTPTPPRVYQAPAVFRTQVRPGITARRTPEDRSVRNAWAPSENPAERIRAGVPAFAKKFTLLHTMLTENITSLSWRTAAAIAGRLLDRAKDRAGIPSAILRQLRQDLETMDPRTNKSTLRDVARGVAFKILQEVDRVPALREVWAAELPKDVALLALLRTRKDVESEVLQLRTSERVAFTTRLGEKSDQERDLIKQLLNVNLAPYVITLRDRQLFAEQFQERLEREIVVPADIPEEGLPRTREDTERDDADQGERGDYGDMPNRPYEGNDVYGN